MNCATRRRGAHLRVGRGNSEYSARGNDGQAAGVAGCLARDHGGRTQIDGSHRRARAISALGCRIGMMVRNCCGGVVAMLACARGHGWRRSRETIAADRQQRPAQQQGNHESGDRPPQLLGRPAHLTIAKLIIMQHPRIYDIDGRLTFPMHMPYEYRPLTRTCSRPSVWRRPVRAAGVVSSTLRAPPSRPGVRSSCAATRPSGAYLSR